MIRYLLRRLATAIVLVFLVLTLIFFVIRAVPGDPAQLLAPGGSTGEATEEAVEQTRELLGLNRPLLQQFTDFVGGVITGNLGTSFEGGRPVTVAVLERLPNSLELVAIASLLGILIGVVLGVVGTLRGRFADLVVTATTSFGISVPVYVVGVVLVYVFAIILGWLPAGGYAGWEDPARHIRQLLLPAVTLAIPFSATVARMTRASILETRTQDWVRTARSWGMGPREVFLRHVFRNALTPVVTSIGLQIGLMLGGTILVESVFSYPGLGRLMIEAVQDRDYPIVQGVVVIIAIIFIGLNIVVDLLYGVLDPRVRR